MSDGQGALQTGLYGALSGNVGATVYDTVPQGAAYPYVTIGDSTALDWDTKTTEGQDHTVTLHTWVRGKSRLAAKTIMGAIHGLLHQHPENITATGHSVIESRVIYADVIQDPDEAGHPSGPVWHGVQRVRIITQTN
jgi:hypothetical protein